ncbi:tryptophan synthase subunit alpha [bacterium CG17_big_fil_post_rev_8_21_14_2_50_64_8]|nr:MAG: tryptophan synthase subunit alpha [bacterium CG17_big_fil_post_rev_8_21_14_2_50_64_8]PJA74140.1 MAG: tryptophan synthase subunit alpha [bacterium CG_4_9_14_3_um_filter_65_15]
MMKLTRAVEDLRAKGRKGVVPFFTAGYPDPATTLRLVAAAQQAGCEVVELGLPFSDPIADGPAIQASSQKALAGGMTLNGALELAAEAARSGVALVLMGYVNPLLHMGMERFADRAATAGVAGLILPDVPREESREIRGLLVQRDVAWVDLVARTTPLERVKVITADAEGFVYLVSVTGVTGTQAPRADEVEEFVERVGCHTARPLYVGFGVDGPSLARAMTRRADGVIIGSALVEVIERAGPAAAPVAVRTFLDEVQQAVNPTEGSRP